MIKLSMLDRIAEALAKDKPLPPLYRGDPEFQMKYRGKVVAKERPRMGKNGHVYTPKETREYETLIRDKAREAMKEQGLTQFAAEVCVHLTIHDKIDPALPDWVKRIAEAGYIHKTDGGDIDNKLKAVLDALNKVVYADDRQVIQSFKVRKYSPFEGFDLTITSNGLTKHDLVNLSKLMRKWTAD